MIQIENTIVGIDIVKQQFVCDLSKCKGVCCVHGDSGAPLEQEEAEVLENIYPLVKPYMRKEGIDAITKHGNVHMVDSDGDTVTVLIDNKECSFVVFEEGIARCAIEIAFKMGAVKFRKPVSCHLYPVRVKKYRDFEAVNYDKWEICKPAVENGKQLGVPVYVFLEEPLKRKFGEEWYRQLVYVADELKKETFN